MRRFCVVALLISCAGLGVGCAVDPHLAAGPPWMTGEMRTDVSDMSFTDKGQAPAPVPNAGAPVQPAAPTR